MDQLAAELGMDRARAAAEELHPARRTSRPRWRSASSTTPATTTARSTGCSSTSTSRPSAASRPSCASRAIYRGIGFSTWMEICGLAPSRVVGPSGVGLQAGFCESSIVRVHASGVGDRLHRHRAARPGPRHRVRPGRRRPRSAPRPTRSTSCTATPAPGRSASAPTARARSRSAASRWRAPPTKVAEKAKPRSSRTSSRPRPEDIELNDGKYSVKGSPDKGMTLAEVAGAAYIPENLPEGMEPGLEETTFYDPENFVFPFGAHACIVDVDAETGKVDVVALRLRRRLRPGDQPDADRRPDPRRHRPRASARRSTSACTTTTSGQLVTGTFVDYALPSAADVPSFETDRTETPSPVNSLGVKGVGEAGTIAASPAVVNAVDRRAAPAGRHATSTCRSARRRCGRRSRRRRAARAAATRASRAELGRARLRQRRLRTDPPSEGGGL